MASLSALTDSSVRHGVRKTAEDPPRVSVYDVIGVITGQSQNARSVIYSRLVEKFPEVSTLCCTFKFPGQGLVHIPVTCARGIVTITMLLPGRAAAGVRREAANCLVRFLGGDMSMVAEIAQNRLTQGELDEEHPARIFGQAVEHQETETIKRKREEVTLSELDLQLCEQAGALKRRRIETIKFCVSALEDLGGADDRDKMRAADMVRTIIFTSSSSSSTPVATPERPADKEICIREFVNSTGRQKESPGLDIKVGRLAKKLLLDKIPSYVFPKKTIYANGQSISTNCWFESQKVYIERALAAM